MKMRVIYCALFCLLAPTSVVLAQDVADDDTPPPPPPPPPMSCPQMGQQQQMCMPPQCGMNMQQGLAPQMMRHPQARQGHHRGDMLKKMQEDLNLTDEQVLAMKELRKTMAQKRKEALKKAMEAIKTQDDAELKKILTEEQYKEFTEKREKMRAHVKERFGKGNRDGKFAPPPFPCEEDEA